MPSDARNVFTLDGYDGLAGERDLALNALKDNKAIIKKLIDIGMNIESIREIAGHEDERTTLHSYIFDRSTKSDIEKYLDDL